MFQYDHIFANIMFFENIMFLKISCFWKYHVFENIMFLKISHFWKYHILQYMMYSNTSCFQNIMFSYFEALTTNLPNHQQPPCQPSPGACRRPRRTQSLTWIMRTKSSWSVDPLRSVANIDLQARAARAGPATMRVILERDDSGQWKRKAA